MTQQELDRRLGDSYAIALLHWPAVIGLIATPGQGWWIVLKLAFGIWVGLLALALVFGRRAAGTRFGTFMVLCAALVGAAWIAHPGPWMYLWLVLLVPAFYGAQRARMIEPVDAPKTGSESRGGEMAEPSAG